MQKTKTETRTNSFILGSITLCGLWFRGIWGFLKNYLLCAKCKMSWLSLPAQKVCLGWKRFWPINRVSPSLSTQIPQIAVRYNREVGRISLNNFRNSGLSKQDSCRTFQISNRFLKQIRYENFLNEIPGGMSTLQKTL